MRGWRSSALLVCVGVVWGCSPEPPAEHASAPAPGEESAQEAESPFRAVAPSPQAERSRRAAAPSAAGPEETPPEETAADSAPSPLEALLRIPAVDPAPADPLAAPRRSSVTDAPAGEPGAPWKGRVRVEGRSEKIGPAGPRQGRWSETEAGVRLPVDDRVTLEGGVRVESRDEPEMEEPERRSNPQVGVEVRF